MLVCSILFWALYQGGSSKNSRANREWGKVVAWHSIGGTKAKLQLQPHLAQQRDIFSESACYKKRKLGPLSYI